MASSSWSQQPSWTGGGDDGSSSHRSIRKEVNSPEVSPFSPGSHNLALDLGQVFLMGDLGKYSDSIGMQLHYNYGVSELFSFDSSLGYSNHSSGQLSMVSLLTGMRLNMSWYDKIIPYLVVGLGFYKPSYQNPAATNDPNTATISSVLFGIHAGPGVDLELSKNLFFGAALTIHNMFGTSQVLTNGQTFGIGGVYTSFFLHMGVTF